MTKLYFPLSSVAAAVLVAACGGYEPVTPTPVATTTYVAPAYSVPVVVAAPAVQAGTVVTTQPGVVAVVPQPQQVVVQPALRTGYARVDSITPAGNGTRIGVRMEQGGTLQYLDTPGGTYVALGQRVEVTNDGHLSYPIPDRR